MASRRAQLVRRNFEAYRDLVWIEDLEPKFRERGVEGKELQSFREAWNEHAEIRDWAWWQQDSANRPSGRLEDEIMDITDRLDQLGCLRWLEERQNNNFDRALADSANRGNANDKEEEIER
jgi:hypothetical protein